MRISQRGPGAARNVGIEATPCEWVGLLDADDHWRPEFLARTAAVAKECPDLVAVFTAAHALNVTPASGSTFSGRIEDYHRARLQFKVAMSSSSILLKRAAFLDIGGFAEGYRYAEDTEAWFRLSCAGPTYYIDEQLCELELSDPTSVTKVASSMERAAGLRKLADSFDRYLQSGRIPAGQIASCVRFMQHQRGRLALHLVLAGHRRKGLQVLFTEVPLGVHTWREYVSCIRAALPRGRR